MDPNNCEKYLKTCKQSYSEAINDYENLKFNDSKNKIIKIINIFSILIKKNNLPSNYYEEIIHLLKIYKKKLYEINFETMQKICSYSPLNNNEKIEGYIYKKIFRNPILNFQNIFEPTNSLKEKYQYYLKKIKIK